MKRASITEQLAYGSALDRLTGGLDKDTATPVVSDAPEPVKTSVIKLSVFLDRDEDSFLETLASTAKFSGGKKLSKTRLVEAMVKAFRATRLDVRGVKTQEELLQRVIAQIRR